MVKMRKEVIASVMIFHIRLSSVCITLRTRSCVSSIALTYLS